MAKSFKTTSSELTDITVNLCAIQHAQEQVFHSSKPVDTICLDKCQGAHTSCNGDGHTPPAPSRDSPNCIQQHPASIANCPTRNSSCSKCDTMGHWGPKCCGGKPPPPRSAPLPKNAPPTGSQHGKSRCPPGSHSCHLGRGGKTDTIDVGEDHSPQDEIVLYGIQANATTIATTHTTANTEETTTYNELFIDTVNCGTAGDIHSEEIVVAVSVPNGAMKHIQWYNCLQGPAVREQPQSVSRSTWELKVMCCPSMSSDVSTQTRSAQLACPLAWITSAPG